MDSSSSEEEVVSSIEGTYVARQPKDWLTKENVNPSPSELYTFQCPYTLRKTVQIPFKNHFWTIGDIVCTKKQASPKTIYAQIIELHRNNFCEKRAKVIWLAPKSNIGVTDESKMVQYDQFNPKDFVHVDEDTRLIPLDCLSFVMHVPNEFEYKKHIGTDCLVDHHIISHAERYADSDENDGPKSKSKVRRLLNK